MEALREGLLRHTGQRNIQWMGFTWSQLEAKAQDRWLWRSLAEGFLHQQAWRAYLLASVDHLIGWPYAAVMSCVMRKTNMTILLQMKWNKLGINGLVHVLWLHEEQGFSNNEVGLPWGAPEDFRRGLTWENINLKKKKVSICVWNWIQHLKTKLWEFFFFICFYSKF